LRASAFDSTTKPTKTTKKTPRRPLVSFVGLVVNRAAPEAVADLTFPRIRVLILFMIDPAPAPAETTLARHQRMLQDLAAICMDAAQTLGRQVAETGKLDSGADPARSLERLARAVRLTLALEAKLVAQAGKVQAADAKPVTARAWRGAPDPDAMAREEAELVSLRRFYFGQARREAVRQIAEQTMVAEAHERGERGDVKALLAELNERFDRETPDDIGAYMDKPVAEWVAELCRELKLTPDATLMAAYADWGEAEEMAGRPLRPMGRDPPFAPP
jgi:hypothetical protein